jgi:putative heme-binding domain-containing protein
MGPLHKQEHREALLALYQVNPESFPAKDAMGKLVDVMSSRKGSSPSTAVLATAGQLELLRLIELTLLAGGQSAALDADWLAQHLLGKFPQEDTFSAEETARILAVMQPSGTIDKLLAMLGKGMQEEQIHYALCLRYVDKGWTYDQRVAYLDWYEKTKDWEGGASFAPFLANIVEAALENISHEERHKLLEAWKARPHAARLLVERSEPGDFSDFAKLMEKLIGDLYDTPTSPERDALLDAAIQAVAKSDADEVQALFRRLYDDNPDRRNELARVMAKRPVSENWPYLLRTLDFADSATMQLCLVGLSKIDRKAEKPAEFRSVILSGLQLGANGGSAAVTLLQRWTGKKHHQGLDSAKALEFYQQWFADNFPSEPPAELPKNDPSKSRYSMGELTAFLDTEPGHEGDPVRGKQMFAKANCIKCHQFLKDGQGVGPDLTSVRRRFQRKEIVESIVMPSKVISDQYRSVTVVTTGGLVYTGLPLKQVAENKVALILPDATKLELSKDEIDETQPATISVMPENLLRELSLEDVADLFAFLETSKNNDPVQAPTSQAASDGKR